MLCIELFSTTKTNILIFPLNYHTFTKSIPHCQHAIHEYRRPGENVWAGNRPNEILTNIIQHVQMESGSHEMEVRDKGESEVNKLSRPRCNTIYLDSFIKKHAAQYQAHLKRISTAGRRNMVETIGSRSGIS